MEGMFSYTQAAMERTMKVQEVILRALAKKITWWQAAEIIGISDRQMRRWHDRYEEFGFRGLFDRRRGKPSPKKVPLAVVEKVLGLYREKYFDLNVRHFHEKLQEEHQVEISYSWVKGLLQGAGMVAKGRKRGVHRQQRPRRPLPGMLLPIDGSEHRWFQDERWYDLLVIMDDANSEIYYAQLVEEEATVPVLMGLKEVVECRGVFCALYSDRARHFWLTAKAGEAVDHDRLTQVGRALRELGVHMIPAYSPQARGRSERSFGTWQGRLPQELRLAGITSAEGANAFLRERYIGQFNAKFSGPAAEKGTAFRRTGRTDLNWVFTVQTERVVEKDNTVAVRDRWWQINKTRFRHSLAGSTVTIHEHLDGTVSIRYGPHVVGRYSPTGEKLVSATPQERRGKGGSMEAGENQKQVSTGFHTPLEIPQKTRDSHFPTAPTTASVLSKTKAKAKPKTHKAAA